jgi:hypothetical protein
MITSLMKKLWTLTQKLEHHLRILNSPNPPYTKNSTAIPFIPEPQFDYNIPLLTLPLLSDCGDTSHNHVLETLLSAGVIYSRSLVDSDAVDFPSSVNEVAFQDLCTAFGNCTDDYFWIQYEGVLLWVLLVGTAASRGRKEAAFWMFYLSRTGNFSSAESWLTRCRATRTFLALQKWKRETAISMI